MNIIVITGASSGMGREFALQLDKGLYTVDEFWLVARSADTLTKMAEKMDHPVKVLPCDLTKEEDIACFEAELKEHRPVIRMLINAAGYGLIGDTIEIPLQEQAGQIDLNCRALFEVTRLCIPYMRKKSRIIQLASSAAFLPQPGFAVYAASKSFVYSFSRALREELCSRQIYVTAVCPGPVRTAFFDVAERYGSTLSVKKYTIAEADRVVARALKDSAANRPLSVYGPIIKAFYAMTCVVPKGMLIRITRLLKNKERSEMQ